jgi:glycosyltransferase involved in cell wall biosynthesis
MRGPSRIWQYAIYVVLGIAIVLQLWSAVSTQNIVNEARQYALKLGTKDNVELEKTRQELIGKQIENSTRGVVETILAAGLAPLAAALLTIAGAMVAWHTYVDTRAKERQDRLGTELNDTLTRLVADDARQRAVGIAGLLPFFVRDREDFHLRALAALVAAARFDDGFPGFRRGIHVAIEHAFGAVNRETLMQISWNDVKLSRINLAGRNLKGFDLRDAFLEEARLDGACLDNVDLNNAKLQGAHLEGASLRNANLFNTDLAGASLENAHLNGANLEGVKVLNLELKGADFTQIGNGWRGVPWDAARNWREAIFDPHIRGELEARYGKAVPPLRVLMLMWEIPPMVAGGTWTACYHLVRKLRQRGADVTVIVPWDQTTILARPFGTEIPVVPLGIAVPGEIGSVYGPPVWSPYARTRPDSNYRSWSPYDGSGISFWSTYTAGRGTSGRYDAARGVYGIYTGGGTARGSSESLSGSILFRLIGEFGRRLQTYVRDHPADLIHAHDWVTFDAAEAAAKIADAPWIAHFHSTEADRQPDNADPLIERIEKGAVQSAARIVAPSNVTRLKLVSSYNAPETKVDAVPNLLSEEAAPTLDIGRFESKRVIFLGRLSRQKGIDRFYAVARVVREKRPDVGFDVFGDGEERGPLSADGVKVHGPVGWDERGLAFRNASAIIVPSRSEPFGMVVLEAMQHGVPVIYPNDSGAAEVLQSGIKVRTDDIAIMADHVVQLLNSLQVWETTVREEAREIEEYPSRSYGDLILSVWNQTAAGKAARV